MSFDFPFPQPSFLRGAARVLDLGGTLNRSGWMSPGTSTEAAAGALQQDCEALAFDIREAFAATARLATRARGGG